MSRKVVTLAVAAFFVLCATPAGAQVGDVKPPKPPAPPHHGHGTHLVQAPKAANSMEWIEATATIAVIQTTKPVRFTAQLERTDTPNIGGGTTYPRWTTAWLDNGDDDSTVEGTVGACCKSTWTDTISNCKFYGSTDTCVASPPAAADSTFIAPVMPMNPQ